MVASDADQWWFPTIRVEDVCVFHIDLASNPEREAAAERLLDEKEKARSLLFLHPSPKRQFTLCRAALRSLICDRLGCKNEDLEFGETEYRKPFAQLRGVPAEISFSVSHSGKHGLLALAPERRVGVDVEERVSRRDFESIIPSVFTPDERAELAMVSGERKTHMFFKLWTIKESLIKALGTGFHYGMTRFETPLELRRDAKTSVFRFPHMSEIDWRVDNLGEERFAAALAIELGPGSVQD